MVKFDLPPGHSGSSMSDVILAVYPVLPASVIALLITRGDHKLSSVVIECIVIVVPVVLSFTVFADFTLHVTVGLGVVAALLMFSFYYIHGTFKNGDAVVHKHVAYVTSCRAIVNLATVIAIFSVDFTCFPRRFSKTDKYGISLMDIGAACFLILNGSTTARRTSARNVLLGGVILGVLGIARFILLQLLHYGYNDKEWGHHCNFFFTLALVQVICGWWTWRLGFWLSLFLGVLVTCVHQMTLTWGQLGSWVFSEAPRDNFLAANREWILSLPGYCALYLFGTALGAVVFTKHSAKGLPLFSLTFYFTISCLALWITSVYVEAPSRRLANITFVIWVVFFFLFFLLQYLLLDLYFSRLIPTSFASPYIFFCINSHPLLFFIAANIATGLVNMAVETMFYTAPSNVFIIMAYTVALVVLITFINRTSLNAKMLQIIGHWFSCRQKQNKIGAANVMSI